MATWFGAASVRVANGGSRRLSHFGKGVRRFRVKPGWPRWIRIRQYRRWRIKRDVKAQERGNFLTGRKLAFCRNFVGAACYYAATHPGRVLGRRTLLDIGMSVIASSGWRSNFLNSHGRRNGKAERMVSSTLMLPRIQHEMDDMMNRAGLSLDECANIMAEIAKSPVNEPGERLRAIDMRIRLTCGYAPTRSAAIVAHASSDRLFDAKLFGDGAPPILDKGAEA